MFGTAGAGARVVIGQPPSLIYICVGKQRTPTSENGSMALSKSLPPAYAPTTELQRRLDSFESAPAALHTADGPGGMWDDDPIRRELERLTAEHDRLLCLAATLGGLAPAVGDFPAVEHLSARVGYDNPPDRGPAPRAGSVTLPEPPPTADELPEASAASTMPPSDDDPKPGDNEPRAVDEAELSPEAGRVDLVERTAEFHSAPEPEQGAVAELFAELTHAPEAAPPPPAAPPVDYEELEILRLQNAELRNLVEQAIAQEEEFTRAQQQWEQRQAEFAQRLEQRDRDAQTLTVQLQELEQQVANQPATPPPPKEDELSRIADELDAERCQIARERREMEDERQQLREDEEALMKQMREMEVQMAKERAEMARQRTDLQRLHAEVRHELEQLQRGDGALKDRLAQFQRRHSEVFNRNGAAPANGNGHAAPPPAAAPPAGAPRTGRDSGIMRRFFGNGNNGR